MGRFDFRKAMANWLKPRYRWYPSTTFANGVWILDPLDWERCGYIDLIILVTADSATGDK